MRTIILDIERARIDESEREDDLMKHLFHMGYIASWLPGRWISNNDSDNFANFSIFPELKKKGAC